MGFASAFNSLKSGKVGDAFSFLLVPEDQIAAANNADSKLEALVQSKRAAGTVSDANAAITLRRLSAGKLSILITDPKTSPFGAFEDSIKSSVGSAVGTVKNITTGLASIIPIQVWVVLGVVLLIFLAPSIGAGLNAIKTARGLR